MNKKVAIPGNICMAPNMCEICETSENIKTINFGRLNAVFCCNKDECINKVRGDLIDYINETKNIPLYGINNLIELDFYRKSQDKVYRGKITSYTRNWFCIRYNEDEEMYGITLEFGDLSRTVSLENIFFHNEHFHNLLVNSDNIFRNDRIKVSFNDLADSIKKKINDVYSNSKNKKSCQFFY